MNLTRNDYYNEIHNNKNHYLTENILEYYLKYLFYNYDIIRDKIVPNSKIKNRPDFRIEDLNLIIEFDGDLHFTDSYTILNDMKKELTYTEMGYTIIRIPYWIQLDDMVLWEIFNSYLDEKWDFYEDIASNYPLGFIDKKAKLPADYSELGLTRYYKMYDYYNGIIDKLYKYHDFTLYKKCFEYDSLFRVFNLHTLRNLDNICYIKNDGIVFQGFGIVCLEDIPGIQKEINLLKDFK